MEKDKGRFAIARSIPFILLHLACLLVLWVGVSWEAVAVCAGAYLIRMFGITAGYHRYFSHRSFKTSRIFQFLLALLGATAGQRGPLWWAAWHRVHHRHSDREEDVHSPRQRGFWLAHVGWIFERIHIQADRRQVRDFDKFRELDLLDRYHVLAPIAFSALVLLVALGLRASYPHSGISIVQVFVWGFFVSTVLLYHGTFAVNSWGHLIGSPRFNTGDDSLNSPILALITLGEGWHNNHHRYPGSERQGFYWWEIDLSHYLLKFLSWLGLVWDLRRPPARVYEEAAEVGA